MSSTVWWPSISMSPAAVTARSNTPCRANASSMWERNGSGVWIVRCPVPSSSRSTLICVSLVFRSSLTRRATDVPRNLVSAPSQSYNDGMRGYVLVGCTMALLACGGGGEKKVKKPKPKPDVEEPGEKAETAEDRAKKRHDEAVKIVAEGTKCLPTSLKEEGAPRLELAASGSEAILCAVDEDQSRLLGPVGCWKINLATAELDYKGTDLPPGRGVWEKLDEGGVRAYCLPKDAKAGSKALVASDLEGKKVAV